MKSTLKKLIVATGLLALATTMIGCNTIAGAGTDVQRSGEAIHDTAKDVQKKM